MSPYPFPPGTHAIPASQLDLRPDSEIDAILANPAPVTSDKNIWLFWDTGLAGLPPHHLRTVRAYHRRFSKSGWTIRCLDLVPTSPLNVSAYLDTSSPDLFPAAFREGKLEGRHAAQHTSDLVRWPLLLTHGGAYVDVGLMPIGDLDALWTSTVANPESEIEVLSYDGDCAMHMQLMNYFMASRRGNPLFERCHRLFLKLWEGRTSTDGMSADPLLSRVPLMDVGSMSFTEDGKTYGPKEVSVLLSDYIAQGQVISLVLGLVDPSENWDGPAYAARKVHAMEFMAGAQLVNELTAWNGKLAYDLLSLKMPGEGAAESEEQGKAREIVEQCLARSFAFKLATGLILRVKGDTLGSLWRKNPGKDDVDGTYARWLRWGMVYANPDVVTARVERGVMAPLKTGRLLEV